MSETPIKDTKDTETRQRILVKAQEIFLKTGFSKVTMDELANELGMSKKTLYKHFSSKEELLKVMMTEFRCGIEGYVNECMISVDIDFTEKLKRIMTFIGQNMSRISTPFADDLRRNAPEIWRDMDEFRKKHSLTHFAQLFKEGVEAGVFRADVSDYLVALIYTNSMQSIVNPAVLAEIPFTAHEVFEAIRKVVFEGILTEEGRKKLLKNGLVK